jgi:hypothetical protein
MPALRPNHLQAAASALAAAAVLAAAALSSAGAAPASLAGASPVPALHVIASGLDQPKKLTFAADGDLIVALSGDGRAPASCTDGDQLSCVDRSGAIDAVSPSGRVTRLLAGLPSVASGHDDPQATGPVEALQRGETLEVLFQSTVIDAATGTEIYGRAGHLLDDLVAFSDRDHAGSVRLRLGAFEAAHNPDHGAGTDVAYGDEPSVDSDPYAFVAYRGGYAIADAGANDVLFLSPAGRVSVLAVLPTIRETAPPHTYSRAQTRAIQAAAQPVPAGLAVGPDGALYVGELGGEPFARGASDVYRIVPGHPATVYARGLTAIGDIAFDRAGRLLVVEIDRDGLDDPGLDDGHPAPGALIRIARGGRRSVLASAGLAFPTGLAVSRDGEIYISLHGTASAGSGHGGEIVSLRAG